MRAIIQLLRERIDQGLLTIFIKMKAHRGDPSNEIVDRWADMGRESENIRWSLPTDRPIFAWTENGKTHRSPMNSTAKKKIDIQVASVRQLSAHKSHSKLVDKGRHFKGLSGEISQRQERLDTSQKKVSTMHFLSIPLCPATKNGGYPKRSQM